MDGGMVTHRYEPRHAIAALHLRHALKPSVQFADVFAHTAPFLFGEEGSQVLTLEACSQISLPSPLVLMAGRIQLGVMTLLYAREHFLRRFSWRYLGPDSSPQLGWHWLVLREDRFDFSRERVSSIEECALGNFDEAYVSRTCMLSTYGRGKGSLVHLATNINNILKMESASREMHDEMCDQVFAIVADQGTERGIADMSTMEAAEVEQPGSGANTNCEFRYRNALWMPEHLHIHFNALQHSVESLSTHKHWLKRLRDVESFLSDGGLRRLFIKLFMADDPKLLQNYSRVHIDWRWEMLSKALDKLVPIAKLLRDRFNLVRFTTSAESEKLDAQEMKNAYAALHTPHFVEMCELIRTHGHILERSAHRLEGCECHREIWIGKGTWKSKRQKLHSQTGYHRCCMKTRQGAWFQAVGLDMLLAEIDGCTSELLEQMITSMSPGDRANMVRLKQELSQSLKEEINNKYGFHRQLPYSCIKIFWGETTNGSTEKARTFASAAIQEYDGIVAQNRGHRLHRVAHLLLRPGSSSRTQLAHFVTGDKPLRFYPAAYSMIKRYAMSPLVGRRVEGVHHEIKTIGLVARNMNPPLNSATLTEKVNLANLKSDPMFAQFVLRRWPSRTLYDEALHLVLDRETIRGMTRAEKINHIYQCAPDCEFRDVAAESTAHRQFLAITAPNRSGPRQLPMSWKLAVAFLKSKFMPTVIYSLPMAFFNSMLVSPKDDELALNFDPWLKALELCVQDARQLEVSPLPRVVWFEVVNVTPESRRNLVLHHVDRWPDAVEVEIRQFLSQTSDTVRLLSAAGNQKTMHLRVFVNNFTQYVQELYAWKPVAVGYGMAVARREPAESQQAFGWAPMLLPNAGGGELCVTSASGASASSSIVAPLPDDRVALDVLMQLQVAPQGEPGMCRFRDLQGVHHDQIELMARYGALTLQHDEFGELLVAAQENGWRHVSVQTVNKPAQVMFLDICRSPTKLNMAVMLIRHGWVAGSPEEGFKRGDPKVFIADKLKPTSYFNCLTRAEELFAKGVKVVEHNWKDVHYQCLLRLEGNALKEFLRKMELGPEDGWCRRMLQEKATDLPLRDTGDGRSQKRGLKQWPAFPPSPPSLDQGPNITLPGPGPRACCAGWAFPF